MKPRDLVRYWIEFERSAEDRPAAWLLGVGVTAIDRDDALALVAARVFPDRELPRIAAVREDVDVSTLDPGHVLPNMEAPIWRGVWFPRGYS